MTHHVGTREVHERQPLDVGEHPLEAAEPTAPARHVDLARVTVDHDAAAEPDAGEEHLHLLGRRVLGLVEDDEAVVQRAAAHEGERRDLHGLTLEELLGAFGLDHVVEGVVERPQVGVDLGHQVARQESQALARFHGGPGEDDALHLLGLQRLHGKGDRQPTLARAGGAEGEGDHVLPNGVDVALLTGGLRPDRAALGPAKDLVGQHPARSLRGAHHVDRASEHAVVERLALLEQEHELLHQLAHLVGVLARDRDLVASHDDLGTGERPLDLAEVLVVAPDEGCHEVVPRHDDVDLRRAHRPSTVVTCSIPSCSSWPVRLLRRRGPTRTARRGARYCSVKTKRRRDTRAGAGTLSMSVGEPG